MRSRRDLLDLPQTREFCGLPPPSWQFCHRDLGDGGRGSGAHKSIHVPCCLTKPTGLTTGHALSKPVKPSFLVLPASDAGPVAGTQLCLWVAVFALGILSISFYKSTGSDKYESCQQLLHDAGTLTLIALGWSKRCSPATLQ